MPRQAHLDVPAVRQGGQCPIDGRQVKTQTKGRHKAEGFLRRHHSAAGGDSGTKGKHP